MNNREKLTNACRKAASDPRLTPQLRAQAKHSYKNLQAIATKGSLQSDICFSLDAELMAHGLSLAIFYIEQGARDFTEVANSIAAELDASLIELRPYLRCWYNGARDILEDSCEDVSYMDRPSEVWDALQLIDDIPSSKILTKVSKRYEEKRNRFEDLLDDFASKLEISIIESYDPNISIQSILKIAKYAELADVRATYRTDTPENFVMDLVLGSHDARAWVRRMLDTLDPMQAIDGDVLIDMLMSA